MNACVYSNVFDSSAEDADWLCVPVKAVRVNSTSELNEEEEEGVMRAISVMGTWGQKLRQACY